MSQAAATETDLKFVDIGANLLDERFTEGSYRGKPRHEPDFDQVVARAQSVGLQKIILTAGTLKESKEAIELARSYSDKTGQRIFHSTVGVHPTRSLEFEADGNDPDQHLQNLLALAKDGMADGTVVAVGEMGLDYDRLEFCPKEVQRRCFLLQLTLAQETGLPLFLHNRNVGTELVELLAENKSKWEKGGGVAHSFDGSAELASKFVDLELYIGLNGCSLKTQENLQVVKTLPLDRILLETDCPYCDVKRTHAGYEFVKTTFPTVQEKKFVEGSCVKGRNEPSHIIQVAEVVSGARGETVEKLVEAVYANSMRLYRDFQS